MSRTDESGRDGLEVVDLLAALQQSVTAAKNARADHPPTPTEEPAEVAVEERGAFIIEALSWAETMDDGRLGYDKAAALLRDHDAALTAKAKAEAWDEGYEAGSEDQIDAYWADYNTRPNPYRSAP